MSDLPPIFIPSGVYGEPMLGTADMWRDPEGRYVKASDYLALRKVAIDLLREKLAAEEQQHVCAFVRDQVRCPRCDNYFGGHATGGDDICDCFPRDATYTGDIKRE